LPDGSATDRFVEKDKSFGTRSMLTVSLIGWTPKDRERRCGFSVKKYGPQQHTDQYMPDCGNGIRTDGKTHITGTDPHDTSMPINASFANEWVHYLVKKYGPASKGGVLFYEMDNEYELWTWTHRDVRTTPVGTDEIIKLNEEYAAAVKEADPSALVVGPVGCSLITSGLGYDERKTRGDFGVNYLKAMKAAEGRHKKRLIDFYDVHYYPQSKNEDAVRLRSTRSLYDPQYVDESWLRDLGGDIAKINFLPKMKKMIADNYPGTKTAITEYSWGALDTISGALAQADVLGIFGSEGLDLASLWGGDNPTQPWAYAFRMFRNYDGKGSEFGDTSVTAKSNDRDKMAIYASLRNQDKHLVVLVINKDPSQAIDTKIAINGFDHSGNVKVYTYSSADLHKIVESSATISGNNLEHKFPAYSITLFAISPK
jgi:hypothetical protein